MPNWLIHFGVDILLLLAIFMLDKDVRKNSKVFIFSAAAVFASNLIDIDHLLATPIYSPYRCSITVHPLHSIYLFLVWLVGVIVNNKIIKYFCLGVLLHVWLDLMGCGFV